MLGDFHLSRLHYAMLQVCVVWSLTGGVRFIFVVNGIGGRVYYKGSWLVRTPASSHSQPFPVLLAFLMGGEGS